MTKAVLLPVTPYWADKIRAGDKTAELRKTMPKLEPPFLMFFHQTKTYKRPGGVFGMALCTELVKVPAPGVRPLGEAMDSIRPVSLCKERGCLDSDQIRGYLGGKNGCLFLFENFTGFDELIQQEAFRKPCQNEYRCNGCCFKNRLFCGNTLLNRPQSWVYVDPIKGWTERKVIQKIGMDGLSPAALQEIILSDNK